MKQLTFVISNGQTITVSVEAEYSAANIYRASRLISDFLSKNVVTIDSTVDSDTLYVNGQKHNINPYDINLTMMIQYCGLNVDEFTTLPLAQQQLVLTQTINGKKIAKTCNASLLVYTKGYVVLQKNLTQNPIQWASVGGKVDVDDAIKINYYEHLPASTREIVMFLREKFTADTDSTIAIFAFAALREAIEEIGKNNSRFIYGHLLAKTATLVRVDRAKFGIPEKSEETWTELFYLDFGTLEKDTLMEQLAASGEKDCTEIIAAPIKALHLVLNPKKSLYDTFYRGLMVRPTVSVIARLIDDALPEPIADTAHKSDKPETPGDSSAKKPN